MTGDASTTTAGTSLIGYAVLRANFNADAPSYLDNFSNFVLDVLARHYPDGADESTVAAEVRQDFGFTIPDRTVGVLLRKAAKKGRVEERGKVFRIADAGATTSAPLQEDIARFQRQQDELNSKFIAFVSERFPDEVETAADRPGEHLRAFIQIHAVPLLGRALRGDTGDQPDWSVLSGVDYLIALFIRHLVDMDNVAFGYVVEAVKGAILAAVLDLKADLKRSLRDMTIMLDTPVVLKALGYNGTTQREAVRQTIALAATLGVTVACFDHTIKELDGVLDSVQGTLKSRGQSQGFRREVDDYFLGIGATAADVEIERSRMRQNVQAIGIRVVSRPDDYYKFGLDENKLDSHLQDTIGYRTPTTRRYDVMSLSAVHRQRRGGCAEQFEKCGYVLITDNPQLVYAAKGVDERHNWPLAMTDADLSALLWVRSPATAEDLPRQQLLAAVYTGMQPSAHLWAKYLLEIERLQRHGKVNDDEALILRSRPEARRALMDVTRGAASEVDTESVEAVVRRVRGSLEGPLRDELGRVAAQRDGALRDAEYVATQAEARVRTIQSELAALRDQRDAQRMALQERAHRRARRLVSGATACIGLGLLVVAALGLIDPHGPRWLCGLAGIAGAVFLLDEKLERWIGVDWRARLNPLEARLERYLASRYFRALGLAGVSADPMVPADVDVCLVSADEAPSNDVPYPESRKAPR
jgi:hypothetical protein